VRVAIGRRLSLLCDSDAEHAAGVTNVSRMDVAALSAR